MIVLRLNAYCDVSQTNIHFGFFITVIYNTNLVQFNDDFMSVTTVKWIGNNLNAIIWKNNNKKNISYTLLTVIYVTEKKK